MYMWLPLTPFITPESEFQKVSSRKYTRALSCAPPTMEEKTTVRRMCHVPRI